MSTLPILSSAIFSLSLPISAQDEDAVEVPTLELSGARETPADRRQVGLGIFETPTQSPLQVARIGIAPAIPSTLPEGKWAVYWHQSLVNMWSQQDTNPEFRFDYGQLESGIRFSYGVTDDVLVSLTYQNLSRFDSILDPITDGFHDLFGLDDSGRDDFPEKDNAIEYPEFGLDIEESGTIRENVILGVTHTFYDGDEKWPTLAWSLGWRENVYTDTSAGGDGNGALALSVSMAKRFNERDHLYAVLMAVRHEEDEWDLGNGPELDLEREQQSVLLAYERRYKPSAAWVLQYLYTSVSSDDIEPFHEASHEILVGWKGKIGERTMLELGVFENAIVADSSPDFGLHYGITYGF